ncbi:hypothetical protein [Sporosalibacterium faouarense]|uniref:hypothetical protein n=1 Tax=Sporosalibacterium faouarense TaxID=516123 RepID=UPI00192AF49B|nr:hypothetical protein [Sporosalibacterium faouarense]
MGKYLTPKAGIINWDALDGFFQIGATVITILGVFIILGALIFLGIRTVGLLIGKGGGIDKKSIQILTIGIIAGILLASPGWLKLLGFIDKGIIRPAFNEKPYEKRMDDKYEDIEDDFIY